MKEKIKKIFKNRIFVFILGGILFSGVSVYAVTYFPSNQVTYDNSTSKLNSTDVQGAIDELYNTCSSSINNEKYIYYIVENDGIYRMNIDGSGTTRISNYGINPTSIYVTDDYIYYGTDGEGIYRMSINGGNPTRLGNYGISASSIAVTSDYIYYLYNYSTSYQYIYRMPINGGNTTSIAEIRSFKGNLFIN